MKLLSKFIFVIHQFIFTEMASDKIEIIDFSGENFSLFSIPCSVSLLFTFFLIILNFIFIVAFPIYSITIALSLILIILFVLYFLSWVKNPAKLRKFAISEEIIEIVLPHVSRFHKSWSQFNKIEVRLKCFDIKPYRAYELYFIRGNSEDCFIISLLDFHKDKINKILALLKEFSRRKNKTFSAVKERMISGIVKVEDLNI